MIKFLASLNSCGCTFVTALTISSIESITCPNRGSIVDRLRAVSVLTS
jgi:hypothetical protein